MYHLQHRFTERRRFRVASVSDNYNSFGLRGMILVSPDGLAYEVAANDLNVRRKGADLFVQRRERDEDYAEEFTRLCFEIPNQLSRCPEGVLKEIFGAPRPATYGPA